MGETTRLRARVEEHVRGHELIPPGGDVVCLVSGGADSTCLWHVLGELGYRVSALHVNHGLRGAQSDEDARFCREHLGAEVVKPSNTVSLSFDAAPTAAQRASNTVLLGNSEAVLREFRYRVTEGRGLRATGHTASDQVETILYRLVSSGRAGAIKAKREDGVVRPLLTLWRDETEAYCRAEGLPFRVDESNRETKRGLIREEILPLLRRLHPAAERNLLALADEPPRLPRGVEQTLRALLASHEGSTAADLPGGVRATREYDRLSLARGPVRWGPWTIEADDPELEVRAWRSGDRLAGRREKIQDVFVDAKIPRSERQEWPLVVRGDDVVAVPGIVDAPRVRARREENEGS